LLKAATKRPFLERILCSVPLLSRRSPWLWTQQDQKES
jgi:hypothetical protein